MFKTTPNPPLNDTKRNKAAHRAIDHYLNPTTEPAPETPSLCTVSPDTSPESLIANSYETVCSVSALLLDLSDDLTGKERDVALAIHQLSELSVLMVGKAMDQQTPRT
ncbi:DUF6124 family protein [Pseudomonas sp. O64]|uniref:DUF6124 family protein n=1 Tax=unclassified Pseudomonas TaxID=196821 RepID=UPI001F5A8459|nr:MULTISPECIES: DUF6124 family protein [unclassified Pseudomonas]UNM18772.1 hypothetical protein K0P33_25135 [Pseudomonas sp. ArH3a]UXZ21561.1 hypothetical protein KZH41_24240 [Pseudomonas sp. YeP6b]